MIRLTASKELLLKHPYLETMIMNVGLLSVIFSTKSVTQNHRKGISFSRMTLFGAFLSWHLRYYFNIKQGCEVVHHAALPSSACVAYRMNFNDNFDIWWGQRKLFQEDAINWSQPGAEVQNRNLLHGLQMLPLKYLNVSKAMRRETQKHGDLGANLTPFLHHWSTLKEVNEEPCLTHVKKILQSPSEIRMQKFFFVVFFS